LKEIRPSGRGWDGTYNGNLMPTNDYWFTLYYKDPTTGENKQLSAHFTLKT
jgi:gliding motility-associated-like protein